MLGVMTAIVCFRDVKFKFGELSIPKYFVCEVEGGGTPSCGMEYLIHKE